MLLQKRDPTANRLLAALPSKDLKHLLASCEAVDLNFADVLCAPGDLVRYAYFPTDSFISLVSSVDGYASLEVGMIGREGMFGIGLALGVDVSPLHAVVQGGGSALRMNAKRFRRELEDSPALRRGLDRYLYVLLSQLAQATTCARFHVVEARLARQLLMTQDRAHSDQFHLTQDFLSHLLGVRRVGVSRGANSLQSQKLIVYRRGDIRILDRRGLEAASCACYRDDKETYARILG